MSRYIDEHRGRFGVEPICRVLGVSASAYYQRATGAALGAGRRGRAAAGAHRRGARAPTTTPTATGAPGRRCCGAGEPVGRDRVKRLMRDAWHPGRQAPRQAVAHHDRRPGGDAAAPISSSATSRADGPIELWVADFTYLRCWEGLVFFSFVIDVYSRRIVGWQFAIAHAHRPRPRRAADGARRAAAGADVELVHHATPAANTPASPSSRSSTITACSARSDRSATPTTTRMAESFVDTFKTELIADRVWRTRTQLELAIVE